MRQQVGEWLPEIWRKSKGVITQRLAACMIGISDQAVKKAGDKGAIEYYECGSLRLYSFHDCLLYKETRENVFNEVENLEENERLKKDDPQKYKEKMDHEYEEYLKEEQAQREAEIQSQFEEEYIPSPEEIREWEEEKYYESQALEQQIRDLRKEIMKKEKIFQTMSGLKREKNLTDKDRRDIEEENKRS